MHGRKEYNSTAAGTPVIDYDCHAGPDQQFEFAGPDCVTHTSFSACEQYPKNVPPGTTIYTVPSNPSNSISKLLQLFGRRRGRDRERDTSHFQSV